MNEVEIRKVVDDEFARIVSDPSKIKYRSSSVLSTVKNYNKKLKKLEKSLEEAKSDIKNFKYGPGESNHLGSFLGSYADVRLNRAVNRVARLEAEIIDLTGGIKPDDYINSRAIKLKDTMMKNFLVNARTGYAQLAKDAYDEMFNKEEKEESFEEEKSKLESKVSEMEDNSKNELEEKIAAVNAAVEENVDVNDVDAEEVQDEVNENFDEEAKSQAISEAFDDEKYEEEEYEEENPITPITNIEPRKMSIVTPATAVKGINDDIFNEEERDVPVVAEEREKDNYKNTALRDFIILAELKAHMNAENDEKIIANLQDRFAKYSNELADVQTKLTEEEMIEVISDLPEEVRNEIVVVSNENEEEMENTEEVVEEVVEEKEEPAKVEEPVVNEDTRAIEVGTAESIQALQLLQKQNQLLEAEEAKVREEQESIEAKYEEAKRQLLERKKSLEESANVRFEKIKKIEEANARRTEELNAIFNAIENTPKDNNSEKKK